jgi:predicted nucleic acid-binding protein
MSCYVLDACALVALLKGEQGADPEISDDIFATAGHLKASYKFSLADSIALAQAMTIGCELLTADHHEFDKIEGKEPVSFNWIR